MSLSQGNLAAVRVVLKALVGLVLIVVLMRHAEPGAVWETVRGARPAPLAWGFALFAAATLFEVLKLHVLLPAGWRLLSTCRMVFVGFFFNNFLPTNIGGDTYKVLAIRKRGAGFGGAVLPVLLDRVAGLVLLVGLGALYTLFAYPKLLERIANASVLSGLRDGAGKGLTPALVIAATLLLVALLVRRMAVLRERLRAFVTQLVEAWRAVPGSSLIWLTIHSMLYHLCRTFGFYLFLIAFADHVPWPERYLVHAAVGVVAMVPVSIGGLGVREGTITVLLSLFGAGLAAATAVSILNLAILWLKALVGGIWLLMPERDIAEP